MLEIDEERKISRIAGFPLEHFFTSKSSGNMSEKYGGGAIKNQKKAWTYLKERGLRREDEIHLFPSQSPGMIRTPDPTPEVTGPHIVLGNAVITAKEGSVLSLYPADCYPIFLTDKASHFLALIHGSWVTIKRGRIVEKTIQVIRQQFGVKPEELIVGIGPGIQKCCYRRGLKKVDLLRMILKQLREVPKQSIFTAGVCTACSQWKGEYLFFSHYRSRLQGLPEGRFGAFVALKR